MASIYKQVDRSKFYYASFRMPDGKWVCRSTRTTDRGIAERLAHEWEGIAASPGELSPSGAQVARVTREIFERATRTRVESVTVGDYLRELAREQNLPSSPAETTDVNFPD